jgi:hypothetical protein
MRKHREKGLAALNLRGFNGAFQLFKAFRMSSMTVYQTAKNHSMSRLAAASLLLVALALSAAAVRAQAPAPAAIPQNQATSRDVEAAFNRADTNRDGKLDRKEAEHLPAVAQRFEQIDANRDSFISLAELNQAAGS